MKIEWHDPVAELNKNKIILKRFTSEETRQINERLETKFEQCRREINRRNNKLGEIF